jgi:hypothetical protein
MQVLQYEGQRQTLALTHSQAPAAASCAGGPFDRKQSTAPHGLAAVNELPAGYAATNETAKKAAEQSDGLHSQGSILNRYGSETMNSSSSAGGITPIIGGAKRPRLGGNGDQHFVQQPLSVAQ